MWKELSVSNILLTGGKRVAARAAILGLIVLAVAVPATAARAVVSVSSVALMPPSSNAAVNVPVTYTVTAKDSMGSVIVGQNINVELTSAALTPTPPLAATGLANAVASGTSGAWMLTGTVTTGASGTATYTVAGSAPGSILVRVYVGTPPFNGTQTSSSATQFTGNAVVTSLTATPASATAAVGAGHSATVKTVDMMGTPVAGVVPVAVVSGANAGAVATCSATDVTGAATCTYSNPNVGSDTLTIFVNLPTGMTPGRDPGEPFATVTRITQPSALPPIVTVPANITRSVRVGRPGETVRFVATASDPLDGVLVPVCVPPSGTLFPVGTTTVTCTATNSHGLAASANFTITVVLRTA